MTRSYYFPYFRQVKYLKAKLNCLNFPLDSQWDCFISGRRVLFFDKTYLYSIILWGFILKERYYRWEYTKNDKRIEYTEKMFSIFIDTLLLPQITIVKPNWKIIALLAALTGQLTKPFLYIILYLVCYPPLEFSYTFLTTIGIVLLYKGRNYERESICERWKQASAQLKLYQKAYQGFGYEPPPEVDE